MNKEQESFESQVYRHGIDTTKCEETGEYKYHESRVTWDLWQTATRLAGFKNQETLKNLQKTHDGLHIIPGMKVYWLIGWGITWDIHYTTVRSISSGDWEGDEDDHPPDSMTMGLSYCFSTKQAAISHLSELIAEYATKQDEEDKLI